MKGGYSKGKSNEGSGKFNGGSGGGGGGFGGHKQKMKKNIRRLGGGGLSLEVFANAKSQNNQYNPAIIKKQREFYKNAKCVNKYKRTVKQQGQRNDFYEKMIQLEADNGIVEDKADHKIEGGQEGSGIEEDAETSQRNKKNRKGGKKLHELYEAKHEEEEKVRREREAFFKARKEEREKSEARRKALREKMAKKTRSGQPVMKYRIEHMLETLQASSSA